MAKALMAAAQGGHVKVVECLLQKDNTLIVENVSNGKELWKQAITEELSCVFEVLTPGRKVSNNNIVFLLSTPLFSSVVYIESTTNVVVY